MLYLYQIGDWRATLVTSSYAPISFAHDATFRTPMSTISHVSGSFSHSSPVNPVLAQTNATYSGTLVCGLGGCDDTTSYVGGLLALAGRPHVPIIAYEPITACGNVNCNGSCGKCQGTRKGRFLLTYGTVTAMRRTTQVEMGKFSQEDYATFNISLTLYPIWETVDRFRYKWWPKGKPTALTPEILPWQDYNEQFPQHPTWLNMSEVTYPKRADRGFSYMRRSSPVKENPFFYPSMARYGYDQYVAGDEYQRNEFQPAWVPLYSTRLSSHWQEIGVEDQIQRIQIPTHLWPAPPRSLYWFRMMPGTGTITISVDGITPLGETYQNVATLDLAQLDANMAAAGFTGLDIGDQLNVGLTSRGGGYLYRWNPTVEEMEVINVYVPWNYTGHYPGETATGIFTTAIDGPEGIEWNQCHIFRTF